ncbi:MAG: MSEP-CTERM sorting domain-containing protein [Candidatus Azobacteroides sp.]|nr:MSEP-CTERM sorting domain-containing protein [Candidatus Azobacteroides sp.]
MRNLLNPKWLFIINTLPIAALFVIFFGQFSIIKTLLDEDNIRLWKLFGLLLGTLGLLNFVYAVNQTFRKQNVSVFYAIIALFCYISFIYLYGYHLDGIIPSSVPRWMMSGNIFLYVGTFLMPTLAYSLFVLVSHLTPETKEHKAWVNFLIAIAIPVTCYLFYQIILPLWKPFIWDFNLHVLLILIIVISLVFLFFVVRSIFILASKKEAVWQKYQLAWKIPVAIVLPLLGLLVNNGILFIHFDAGIFGNFNNRWFYALAIINGIFLCLPNLDNKLYRLFLFIGRSITFSYTFYFFLVFLPFLPLSIIAIIACGIGFLMLAPLALFVVHIHELSKDFAFLKSEFPKKLIIGIIAIGFLVIPSCITAIYLQDKSILNKTLEYVYSPDYSKKYVLDKTSLQNTLNIVKEHKERNDFRWNAQIPYLSSYFNWLVLNNLTLSDAKINGIERIFFGKSSFEMQPEDISNKDVNIAHISTASVYDFSQKAWKSWVDLELTNKSGNAWPAEYAANIDLPEGCWISDYYLFVGDKKEQGILAEKKSAVWVFAQIRNEKKDPGILYYLTGNKVAFRVFPFAEGEVRKTGIEFLHKEPVKLTIDNNIVELGNAEETINESIETENVVYVSAQQKQTLRSVQRKPYFHFLVDVSEGKNTYSNDFINRMEQILEANKALSENAQISFVNSYIHTFPMDSDWKQHYQSQIFEGAFYLDRAVKTAFFQAYNAKSYPIIVVVTDDIHDAVLDQDFSDFKFAFPESNLFFKLNEDGTLEAHSLVNNPIKPLIDQTEYSFYEPVLEYRADDNFLAYLPDNQEPSIVLKKDVFETNPSEIKEKNWQSALTMQAQWMSQILHPETSGKEWLHLVKCSFISKVMSPVTSYLVVENEAQKAILKKKQEQVLSTNKSLDLGEDTQRMSEPSLWILILLFGLTGWYRKKMK